MTLIDDENATYVIENADEQITSLVAGNVFVYPYAEGEILIVKVAKIEIEGATATITGTELELEEVFAQMKIESSSETADMTVDDSTAAEGISYVGLEEEGIGPQAWEGGGSASSSHTFKVDIEKKKGFDHLDASFSVTGSLKVWNTKISICSKNTCTISYSPVNSKPTATADCGASRRNPSSNTFWNNPN